MKKIVCRKVENGWIIKEEGVFGKEWISTNPILFLGVKLGASIYDFIPNYKNFSIDKIENIYKLSVYESGVETTCSGSFREIMEKLKND